MTAPKRILIADNRPDHLQLRQQLFQIRKWEVVPASSPEEARAILEQQWVHLALIDLRLTNDDDPRDVSGLQLAHETDPVVPKIIMTSWPNFETARDALGLDDKGLTPAVSCVDKGRGFPHLLDEAEKVFAHRVRINVDLKIEPPPNQSLAGLLRQIKPYRRLSDDKVKARATEIMARVAELEDLLRKLFYDAESIRLQELTPGAGGSGVLQVQPVKHGAEGEMVVVKFGQRERMRNEWRRFEHYVQEHTGTCMTAMLGKPEETLHYGGARFTLVGKSKGGQPRLFDAFYAQQPLEVVTAALSTLFETTCARWYLTKRHWNDPAIDQAPEKFEALYRPDQPDVWVEDAGTAGAVNLSGRPDALACAMERQKSLDANDLEVLRNAWGRGVGVTESPSQTGVADHDVAPLDPDRQVPRLPDPIDFIAAHRDQFPGPGVWAITHGDLHGGNILIDDERRVWLIDFYKTGWGPAFRDFAQMEAAVRLEMVETIHMPALAEFELACMAPMRLDEPIAFINRFNCADLEKAAHTTLFIRQLAMKMTGMSEMRAYYVCLLYHSLRLGIWEGSASSVRSFDVRQSHALLSAGLICRRLATWNT